MRRIELNTDINAPIQACFDAARDIGLHCQLAQATGERAVAGRMRGLIGAGEWVTFSARHFGWRFELTAHLTGFEPPFCFVDEQTRGPFKQLRHTHCFQGISPTETLVRDLIEFECPFGLFGRLAEPFVAAHLLRFLEERAAGLKCHVEAR